MAKKGDDGGARSAAASLNRRGIMHGMRTSSPRHANYPQPNEIGSAAYRRRQAVRRMGDRQK